MPELFPFDEGENGFFIKFFLLDASVNLNRWAVTETALRENLASFIGKPFVLTPDFGHPDAATGDDLFRTQEKFRVGDIISVGIEDDTKKAWGIAKITDADAIESLKNGEVSFVSPSVVFSQSDLVLANGAEVVTKFEGAHVAAVKDPAYQMQKAQIKGKCDGSSLTCGKQLQKVQASVQKSSCGKFLFKQNTDSIEVFDANIDPESLDNITRIDIPQRKKKKKENGSLSDSSDSQNSMTTKTAQDEEKEEEQSNLEELEEERKERKEEQSQEEEKKEDSEEEEEEKKESKKAIRELQKELALLKAERELEKKSPFITKIVEAKSSLGRIIESEKQSEMDRLAAASVEDLKAWSAEYEGLVRQESKPYTKYKLQGSRQDSSSKDFDGLILQMREGVN